MHTLETKNQFIELRAEGLSLDAISAQLSVPKTTLGRWHHESLEQIQRLRALQWHLLEDQIGQRLEDTLTHIAQRIRKWDDKLDKQLGVHQKPGDSIRVIRESRREYLQLRALLLAPLQPARRNAPCLTSVAPEKRDKTGQNPDALDTTPLPPNDFQQLETSLSHSAPPPLVESNSVEPATPALNLDPAPALAPNSSSASPNLCGEPPDTQPLINTPLQRGEPAQPLVDTTASTVSSGLSDEGDSSPVTPEVTRGLTSPGVSNNATPQPANAADDSPFNQPKIDDHDFLGSVVVSPYECAAAVVLKTLEHEAAHRARQPASDSQLSTNNPQLTYELMRIDRWQ